MKTLAQIKKQMFNFELKDGLKVKFTHYGVHKEGVIAERGGEFYIINSLGFVVAPEEVHDLRPAEGFWPVMGDVLVVLNGGERTVLAVVGNVYFLSEIRDQKASDIWRTREELIGQGCKIKGQQETITLKEAEKRLGVRIEGKE